MIIFIALGHEFDESKYCINCDRSMKTVEDTRETCDNLKPKWYPLKKE